MFAPKPFGLRPPDPPHAGRRSRGARGRARERATELLQSGLPSFFRAPTRFRGFLRDWAMLILLGGFVAAAFAVIFFGNKNRPELLEYWRTWRD
jgi:hypothetical protein